MRAQSSDDASSDVLFFYFFYFFLTYFFQSSSRVFLIFARLYKRTHFRNGFPTAAISLILTTTTKTCFYYYCTQCPLDISPSISNGWRSGARKKSGEAVESRLLFLCFLPLRIIAFRWIVIESIVIIAYATIPAMCYRQGRRIF